MLRKQFEAQLKLGLARISEHEPAAYAVAISVGSANRLGEFPFDISFIHAPGKVERAMTCDAAAAFLLAFGKIHNLLPACVIVSHITKVPRDQVVSKLMESIDEATALPQPKDVGDVEVWHRWLRGQPGRRGGKRNRRHSKRKR